MNSVSVVECQTCTGKALWKQHTDGMAWAVWHSRETGCPENYRVKPLDRDQIRGRVRWDRTHRRWRWDVTQPGLTVSWGDAMRLVDAQNRCREAVAVYRKLPITWEDDE